MNTELNLELKLHWYKDPDLLHSLFRYDPETGRLHRRSNGSGVKAGDYADTTINAGHRKTHVSFQGKQSNPDTALIVWIMLYGPVPHGRRVLHKPGYERTDNRPEALTLSPVKPVKVPKPEHWHGATRSITYRTWKNVMNRCVQDKTHRNYAEYSRLGVAPEWRDYRNFVRDMGERPGKDYSIDRIDNAVGYFPGNCRWATRSMQVSNQRRNLSNDVKGYYRTKHGTYTAIVEYQGKDVRAGTYKTPAEATAAYWRKKAELYPALVPSFPEKGREALGLS